MHSITAGVAARSVTALAALIACGGGALIAPLPTGTADAEARIRRNALGPAPRDSRGRFENWNAGLPRAGLDVTVPFFLRRIAGRFRSVTGLPQRGTPETAWLRANRKPMEPSVTWVGHATLLVQLGGVNFLTDPVWSRAAGPGGVLGARRWIEPGLSIEELPAIDFVLISHNHYDHLDLPSLRKLARLHPAARFFVPLENGDLLRGAGIREVLELDWEERRQIGGVTVHCLPAQHWSQRGLTDRRRALWSSWAVTSPDRRFYFGGDSGAFEGFERIGSALGPFDLAALPIGAYEPEAMMRPFHLDPEEAVAAALAVGARRMLGIHFGTFDLSDEPVDEPPRRFRGAASAAGARPEDVWILAIGETRRF
jgi:N-acyl-phosphatidylethanolamine-hydrolysing phospholipase D